MVSWVRFLIAPWRTIRPSRGNDEALRGKGSGGEETEPTWASDVEDEPSPPSACAWLQDFVTRHKRRPRVLHVGNIANNAYYNAKLLNRAGLDCDVFCFSNYHIMSCPEWEDADFDRNPGNDFFPAWEHVDLRGFRRPAWFAQGLPDTCLRYLIARRSGQEILARNLWAQLCRERVRTAFWRRNRFLAGLAFLLYLPGRCWRKLLKLCWLFSNNQVVDRAKTLLADFREAFPDRPDQLCWNDFNNYKAVFASWAELARYYDLIIGYGVDAIFPMIAGRKYYALEHGTLRDIPFQPDATGRLTALAYHLAEHVFLTNADCCDKARLLVGDRCTFLNHPFDDTRCNNITGWQEVRGHLCLELDAQFLFFFPTRQDWVPGTGHADKANDIFLRAFARLRKDGIPVGLVCSRWGANVEDSRRLLIQLGVTRHVKWVQPLGLIRYARMARACDLVVDQFKLGGFGGVLFKAMAAGVPCCTYLIEEEMVKVFGSSPPVINAATEDDLVSELGEVWKNPGRLVELSRQSRAWIERYYSSQDLVNKQLAIFGQLLGHAQGGETNAA
jgi:glycosyltransferase involved in cell wall biosynthesis